MQSLVDRPDQDTIDMRAACQPIGVEPAVAAPPLEGEGTGWECFHQGAKIGTIYRTGTYPGCYSAYSLFGYSSSGSLRSLEDTPQLAVLYLLRKYYRKQRDAEATAKAKQEE